MSRFQSAYSSFLAAGRLQRKERCKLNTKTTLERILVLPQNNSGRRDKRRSKTVDVFLYKLWLWKKLLFACICIHTEIKLRWPGQTQFFFFRASYILTGQFGCSLLVLICWYVNGKILLTLHEKKKSETLMMTWIKTDVVFKFTTQHLSYKSVEE